MGSQLVDDGQSKVKLQVLILNRGWEGNTSESPTGREFARQVSCGWVDLIIQVDQIWLNSVDFSLTSMVDSHRFSTPGRTCNVR